MGIIKNKWKHGFYIQSLKEFMINDWDFVLSNSDYNIKYFLNKECRKDDLHYIYNTTFFINLLSNKNIKNLKDFIYRENKELYYNITSWTMFQEWINAYIYKTYDICYQSFKYNKEYLSYIKENQTELEDINIHIVDNVKKIKNPDQNWYIVSNEKNSLLQELIKERLIIKLMQYDLNR